MNQLAAWYRHPEQELLRREIAWLARWMTRPPGVVWVLACVFCHAAIVVASFWAGELGFFAMYLGMLSAPLALVNFGITLYFIQLRTLAPFQPGLLPQIWMSSLNQRNFWPALLAAPILFATLMTLIQSLMGIPVSIATYRVMASGTAFPSPPPGTGAAAVAANPMEMFGSVYFIVLTALGFVSALVMRPALVAFVAWQCFPRRRSVGEIFLWYILGWIICHVPVFAIQMVGMLYGFLTMISASVSVSGGTSAPTFIMTWMKFSQIAGVCAMIIAPLILLPLSIRQLRRPGQMERLRIEAERAR